MNHSPHSHKFKKVLRKVPPNYYSQGVKNNLLQKLWHRRKWFITITFLEDFNGKLLDLGCADGTTARHIHEKFPNLKITGIDLYKDAIKFAKRFDSGINFVRADAHKMPFGDNYFNTVIALEVLEHMHDSAGVLKEIHRVLKKKGILIVGQDTDSVLFKIIWWLWTKSKGSVWTESHISCMRPDELLLLIKKNGFKIKKKKIVNLGMEIFIKAVKK